MRQLAYDMRVDVIICHGIDVDVGGCMPGIDSRYVQDGLAHNFVQEMRVLCVKDSLPVAPMFAGKTPPTHAAEPRAPLPTPRPPLVKGRVRGRPGVDSESSVGVGT